MNMNTELKRLENRISYAEQEMYRLVNLTNSIQNTIDTMETRCREIECEQKMNDERGNPRQREGFLSKGCW